MRRRRKAKKPGSDLRRLALAGRWEEVRTLLEARLARNPHDAEARSELERLRQGIPLRATESELVRRRREEQEMQEELAAELELYRRTPTMLEDWETELLSRRRKRLSSIRRTLGKRLPDDLSQQAATYHAALSSRLSEHHGRRRLWLGLGIGLPLLVATLGGAAMGLRHQAERAAEGVGLALQAEDIPRLNQALNNADSGINRLVNPELTALIERAERWLARVERQAAELEQELAQLETSAGRISTLPLTRRAELERRLNALPAPMEELRLRWHRLCEREARSLTRQRQEVEARFRAPLPPMPELSGSPSEDDARLLEQQKQLQAQAREWEAARELFKLTPALGEPLQARLHELTQLRQDIAELRRRVSLLPSARSYAQYRQRLEGFSPKAYAPALRMQAICEQLPDEDKLREQMQDHGRQLPPGMLAAAREALLHGGPSFTPAFPANARQLQLMEDLFSYTGLLKPHYELSAPTLGSFIVEERPQAVEGSVSFTPSPLTPGYSLDVPRRITWHNAQGVFVRRIDPTPLVQRTGITREDFFRSANVPSLLESLLRMEHEECPALARAFVIRRLFAVMAAHDWPTMLGIAYAPTLRADARDFAGLVRELPLPLEAGCWFDTSPEAARAEAQCAHWLHERRHRHYAQEIARNFAALVQVHPRYVGFINEEGQPQLFRELSKGTLLWYMGSEGLCTAPLGEEPEAPVACSPVFIIAKD